MNRVKLSRRRFLHAAGAAGVIAIPTFLGYGLIRAGQGEYPQIVSPYVIDEPKISLSPVPILVLINENSNNLFGTYLSEILRAEGLNYFQAASLSSIDQETLEQFKLVLLAEGPLNQSQVALLDGFVGKGGRLVAMRPDTQLAAILGLEPAAGNTTEGYLHSDPDFSPETDSEILKFHGTADHYHLAGAQAIAWLADEEDYISTSKTAFPAVTLHNYGHGQAAMWAFDLACSVILTRQGNPAWANQERDGADGIRAHDAFFDWVDLEKIAVPQADEQMRLLSRLMTEMLSDVLPLPRLWYFPGAAERMLIATGDSHQNPAFAIEEVLTRVEERGGHISIYYTPPTVSASKRMMRKARWWAADMPVVGDMATNPYAMPSPSLIADWRARGHEFTFHPEVDMGIDAGLQHFWQEFTAMGYDPVSPTVRTHRILWTGWVETARIQASYGLRMNLDYYHIGPTFQNEAGEWVYGHFTGSGLSMKFVDEQGRILNTYQQLTQLVDEHLLLALGGWAKLDAEEAIEVSRQLLTGTHSAIAAQFHVDPFFFGGAGAAEAGRWLEGTLDFAASQHIPVWSAEKWLHFNELRNNARLEAVNWHPAEKRLSFDLSAQEDPNVILTVMVPQKHGQQSLAAVEVDDQIVEYQQRILNGITYGWLSVEAGSHQIVATYSS